VRRDLVFAIRTLMADPGFAVITVLTLALGIGATSAVFTLLNALVLRPLPYEAPDELALLRETDVGLGWITVSYPDFLDWQDRSTAFESMAAWRRDSCVLSGGELPQQVRSAEVSAELLPMLGVSPTLGRSFLPVEDEPDGDPVVMLTHGFWLRQYGGDPAVVGRTLVLDGRAHTVVGVTPQGFLYPPDDPELAVYRPIEQSASSLELRHNHPGILVTARLRSGITLEAAREEMKAIAQQLEEEYPDTNSDRSVMVDRLQDLRAEVMRPGVTAMAGSVGLVLLIVCTNLAGLFLARGLSRSRELAVRSCLGAPRRRLVRQLLTETAVLTLLGGALGVALATVAMRAIETALPRQSAHLYFRSFPIDAGVLLFTAGVAVLTGLAFGLVPALRACRVDLSSALKEAGRASSEGPGRQRLRRVFVVAQVALALVLLVSAGLVMRSFLNIMVASPGFDPEGVLTLQTSLPEDRYPESEHCHAFFAGLEEQVRSMAGVEAVGLANPLFGGWQDHYLVAGQPPQTPGLENWTDIKIINPEYFRAMRVALVAGRSFTEQDREGAAPVAIIDETLAEQWWPSGDAVGRRVRRGNDPGSEGPWLEIVGVVAHVKTYGVAEESRVTLYLPHAQTPTRFMSVVIRTDLPVETMANQVRVEVGRLDPHQPIFNVRTLERVLADSAAPGRILAILLGVFAGVAILLAAIGIYGLAAYNVGQRRHEMGIRLALGANGSRVFGLVLREGLVLAAIGLAAGLAIAAVVSPLLEALLFQVEARDPTTFVGVAGLLTIVALLACVVPAWRAARVSPTSVLRGE